jgi:hypothetical protein
MRSGPVLDGPTAAAEQGLQFVQCAGGVVAQAAFHDGPGALHRAEAGRRDSAAAVKAVTVSGPGSDLSGFDGDGICSGAYGTWTGSAQCPYGTTDYEGPGTSFLTDRPTTTSRCPSAAAKSKPSPRTSTPSRACPSVRGYGDILVESAPYQPDSSTTPPALPPPRTCSGRARAVRTRHSRRRWRRSTPPTSGTCRLVPTATAWHSLCSRTPGCPRTSPSSSPPAGASYSGKGSPTALRQSARRKQSTKIRK